MKSARVALERYEASGGSLLDDPKTIAKAIGMQVGTVLKHLKSTEAPEPCAMRPDYAFAGRSYCTSCGLSWHTAREAHCRVHHEHFGSWDDFDAHKAAQAVDHRDAEPRVRADQEMDRMAKMPVSLRGTGSYLTTAQQITDTPDGWITRDPQPGHPWARTSSTFEEWRAVNLWG